MPFSQLGKYLDFNKICRNYLNLFFWFFCIWSCDTCGYQLWLGMLFRNIHCVCDHEFDPWPMVLLRDVVVTLRGWAKVKFWWTTKEFYQSQIACKLSWAEEWLSKMSWATHIYSVTSTSNFLKGQLKSSFSYFLPFPGPQTLIWEPNIKLCFCFQ